MSEWRRKALSLFGDRAPITEHARSLYDLWFSLLSDIQDAYRAEPPRSEFIDRVWEYAAWCFAPKRNKTVRNAVAVSFYEHLPHFGPARREMPQRLSQGQFEELLPAFRVSLTDREYQALVIEFLRAQGMSAKSARDFLKAAT